MNIRMARRTDLEALSAYDRHISGRELATSLSLGRVLAAGEGQRLIGWLRWNLFWDNTPFMNMLFLHEAHRNRGYGTALVFHWEQRMRDEGYRLVMTSTLSSEGAQHFYRKLGYVDAGGLLLPGEPLEILFIKEL